MSQANEPNESGNGKKPEDASSEMTVFEPAFVEVDDTEPMGWWKSEPGEEEGEFIPDLPPELDDSDPPSPN